MLRLVQGSGLLSPRSGQLRFPVAIRHVYPPHHPDGTQSTRAAFAGIHTDPQTAKPTPSHLVTHSWQPGGAGGGGHSGGMPGGDPTSPKELSAMIAAIVAASGFAYLFSKDELTPGDALPPAIETPKDIQAKIKSGEADYYLELALVEAVSTPNISQDQDEGKPLDERLQNEALNLALEALNGQELSLALSTWLVEKAFSEGLFLDIHRMHKAGILHQDVAKIPGVLEIIGAAQDDIALLAEKQMLVMQVKPGHLKEAAVSALTRLQEEEFDQEARKIASPFYETLGLDLEADLSLLSSHSMADEPLTAAGNTFFIPNNANEHENKAKLLKHIQAMSAGEQRHFILGPGGNHTGHFTNLSFKKDLDGKLQVVVMDTLQSEHTGTLPMANGIGLALEAYKKESEREVEIYETETHVQKTGWGCSVWVMMTLRAIEQRQRDVQNGKDGALDIFDFVVKEAAKSSANHGDGVYMDDHEGELAFKKLPLIQVAMLPEIIASGQYLEEKPGECEAALKEAIMVVLPDGNYDFGHYEKFDRPSNMGVLPYVRKLKEAEDRGEHGATKALDQQLVIPSQRTGQPAYVLSLRHVEDFITKVQRKEDLKLFSTAMPAAADMYREMLARKLRHTDRKGFEELTHFNPGPHAVKTRRGKGLP